MSDPPRSALWIGEAEVAELIDMREAIAALLAGLLGEARGEAQNMTKTHVAWERGTLHAIGAAFPREGIVGTKTWAHTEGGANPLLVLYDSANGALLAVIEAFVLGQLRTGAASGVATRLMAAEDADELALVGTGKQALAQVAAVAAVRRLRRVSVFGRDAERRRRFAARVREELGLECVEAQSLAEAARDAPIVTTVTRARQAFLVSSMVARGAHVNAVGAIVPEGAEVAADVIARCDELVADSPAQARKLSRELGDPFGADEASWSRLISLAERAASGRPRSEAADVTLFKSLGMGVSDLSLGIEVYRRAVGRGMGRLIPHPEKAVPRLLSGEGERVRV